MLLREGITGFNSVSSFNFEDFKKLCYAISAYNNARLISFESHHTAKNFYEAKLDLCDEKVHLLINQIYPFIALASSVEYFNIQFTDHVISSDLAAYGGDFRLLSKYELNEEIKLDARTLTVKNENSLNPAELKQLNFWKPKTVGEVIYNFWD
jgi:hypothetical protein